DLLGSSPEGSNGCRETHPRTQWPLALAKALTMRQTIRNSQNEPGMCPGINRLTFWCGPQTRLPRLAHIAKSAMYAPPEAGFGCAKRTQPLGNEAGMCPGINCFTKFAPIAGWVRRGVPLWCFRVGSGGAPVVGVRNGRAVKALPYGAADETRKTKIRKTNLE